MSGATAAGTTANASGSTSSKNDIPIMSVTVGGRLFQPALAKPAKIAGPTSVELEFNKSLTQYSDEHVAIEPESGIRKRERALIQIGNVCREWIQFVGQHKQLPMEVRQHLGGKLFVSGSYRLGVHEPGADIDAILVAPSACHRSDFFGTTGAAGVATTTTDDDNNNNDNTDDPNYRHPDSLSERLRRHPDVTNFNPVETAAIPLLTFDWEGINIDLLFARLNNHQSVPLDLDIDNDAVLDGVDGATEKSLNGPRVTNLIAAFCSTGPPSRYQNFLATVRLVRKWAKARGLYNNKMGYWGGVNINMAVAVVVQLYPNACVATMLRMFFLVFQTWKWPRPVMLTVPHDAGYNGLQVWSATTNNGSSGRYHHQIAPMITPAYPSMNSTLAVSRQTLRIMQEEFERGHRIVDQLWKSFQMNHRNNNNNNNNNVELDWARLFDPSDFFIAYPNYLSLCIVGPSQSEAAAWAGFVESRLRKLVSDILGRSLPLKKIQLWPKKIEACIADKSAVLLTQSQRQNSMTYFIGFSVDKQRMRGDVLNAEIAAQHFRDWELVRFQPLIPGMDVLTNHFKVKNLPRICFTSTYGPTTTKRDAMKRRRQLRDTNPARLARKKQELQEQRAELERKIEERQTKKRKRDLVKQEEEAAAAAEEGVLVQTEEENQEEEQETTEETNLLEHALIGDDAATREEAEAAKQKLLNADNDYRGGNNKDGDGNDNADGTAVDEGDVDSSSEDEAIMGLYAAGDGARVYQKVVSRKKQRFKNKRCLPPTEEQGELIRKLGFAIVTDDESKVIGIAPTSNANNNITSATETSKNNVSIADAGANESAASKPSPPNKIVFLEGFDMVELDSHGHVIDKGDEDFTPSKKWTGRQAGFEFKLGERGLGYYRTGKAVQVPSNTAY